jgi:YVTN family beta-propeller protein
MAGRGRPVFVPAYRAPTAYVPNVGSDTVTPISTATNKPGKPIKVGAEPGLLAITPDGKIAYVVNLHRVYAGRQDGLRCQHRLGHGDADHDGHQ